jgi:hypothetical protein
MKNQLKTLTQMTFLTSDERSELERRLGDDAADFASTGATHAEVLQMIELAEAADARVASWADPSARPLDVAQP